MTTKKKPFMDVISTGLSLVVCDGTLTMQTVEQKLCEAKIACASTRWLTTRQVIECGAHLTSKMPRSTLVLLTRAPLMSVGWHLPLDRIVWIGDIPSTGTDLRAAYEQYRNRGMLDVTEMHRYGRVST